jgi:glycosyltransferase involved in cell wall biosynthesis
MERLTAGRRSVVRAGLALEAIRARRFEIENLACYDGIIVACEGDKRRLIEEYGIAAHRVLIVTPSVDLGHWGALPREPEGNTVAFLGSLACPFHRQAAERLLRHIFPMVRRLHPSARLCLINLDAPVRLGRLGDRVEIVHEPADARRLLAKASVVCQPLAAGGVIEGAVLEILAGQAPLVCTPEATDGLGLREGAHFLAAIDDLRLADAVCQLLRDPGRAANLGQRAAADISRRQTSAPHGLVDWLTKLAQLPQAQDEGPLALTARSA